MADTTASDDDSCSRRRKRTDSVQVLAPLAVLLVLFGGLLWMLTVVFRRFRIDGVFRPETTLPVLLLVAAVSLLSALAVTTVTFRRLGLATRRAPLGLPEGSVRAIIALMLLVMFFITAIFVYGDLGERGEPRQLRGVDAEVVDGLAADDILSVRPAEDGGNTFDVELAGTERSAAAADVGKQLVTTVSTLVVAVAAFYFGANTVQTVTQPRTPDPPLPEAGDEGEHRDGKPPGGPPLAG